jgi:hypothetical protein
MDRALKELIGKHSVNEQRKLNAYRMLLSCIDKVGGSTSHYENKILEGMTVLELIDALAPNKITFTITN